MLHIKIYNTRFIFRLFGGHEGSCFLYEGNSVFSFIIYSLDCLFVCFCKYKTEKGRMEPVGFLHPNTVCLPNEPTAMPSKRPSKRLPANQRARSDLATMSRLCKHLIITIKLSINLHYCSLLKR